MLSHIVVNYTARQRSFPRRAEEANRVPGVRPRPHCASSLLPSRGRRARIDESADRKR